MPEGVFSQLILASDKLWNPFLHGRGTVDVHCSRNGSFNG